MTVGKKRYLASTRAIQASFKRFLFFAFGESTRCILRGPNLGWYEKDLGVYIAFHPLVSSLCLPGGKGPAGLSGRGARYIHQRRT